MLLCLFLVEEIGSVSKARLYQMGLREQHKWGAPEMQGGPPSWLWGRGQPLMEKWLVFLIGSKKLVLPSVGGAFRPEGQPELKPKGRKMQKWCSVAGTQSRWVEMGMGAAGGHMGKIDWGDLRESPEWWLERCVFTVLIPQRHLEVAPRMLLILKR